MNRNDKYKKMMMATLLVGGLFIFAGCSNVGNKQANESSQKDSTVEIKESAVSGSSEDTREKTSGALPEINSSQAMKLLDRKESFFLFFGKKNSVEYQHYQKLATEVPEDIADKIYFMDDAKEKDGTLNKKYMFEMALEDGKYKNVGVYFEDGNPKSIWGPTFEAKEMETLFNGGKVERSVK